MPIVDTAKYPKGKNRPHGWARKSKQGQKSTDKTQDAPTHPVPELAPGQKPTR